jgi:SAM-dependent methyltransferase
VSAAHAHFDRLAGHYPGGSGGLEPIYAAARPHLDALARGRDVLDVGGGGVIPYDASGAASVTALDLSQAMLARLPAGAARPVRGDARAMPFEDGAFGLVLFNLSLHHVEGEDGGAAALSEAWRVLRPGGELAVHEPVAGPLGTRLLGLASALLSALGGGPVRLRSRASLSALMAAAAGLPASSVSATPLAPRGWADPLGGTFPGLLRLPLALHPTRFELLTLRKPHG